jgi:hypothetical protein
MPAEPAEANTLRGDRIYDYDEFNELQSRYGGKPRLQGIIPFLPKKRLGPLVLRMRYEVALAAGVLLLLGAVLTYGVLATAVVNTDYRLAQTDRGLHNLSLALDGQVLANRQTKDKLLYSEKEAKALGLVPPIHAMYIVRTNIRPTTAGARTVDELYPLSDRIIEVKP